MSAFGVRSDITFKRIHVPALIVIWKRERLAKQPLRALVPVFETRGVGRFYVVETKKRTHSAYAVYSVSLAGDPGPTSFSNRTRSWTVPNGFSNNGTPS